MRITAQSDYAIRAIFDIAYHGGGLSSRVSEIAERQQISPRFLEQTFLKLRRAGLLGSKRGPRGGYYLLRDASEITLRDIITAVEGPIRLVSCVPNGGDDGEYCQLKSECPVRPLWQEVGDQVANVLRETSVLDLCHRAEQLKIPRQLNARFMYHI